MASTLNKKKTMLLSNNKLVNLSCCVFNICTSNDLNIAKISGIHCQNNSANRLHIYKRLTISETLLSIPNSSHRRSAKVLWLTNSQDLLNMLIVFTNITQRKRKLFWRFFTIILNPPEFTKVNVNLNDQI